MSNVGIKKYLLRIREVLGSNTPRAELLLLCNSVDDAPQSLSKGNDASAYAAVVLRLTMLQILDHDQNARRSAFRPCVDFIFSIRDH